MTIISVIIVGWSAGVCSAQGLPLPTPANPNETVVTPKFVPVGQRPNPGVVNASYPQPLPAAPMPAAAQPKVDVPVQPRRPAPTDEIADLLRTELPGRQRLFMRESEATFYERIRQDAKRNPGSNPAVFPSDEPVISKETYVQPSYPRWDPRTRQPFASRSATVEPCYVMHRRLLFEQPNFERGLYDLGAVQPFVGLGVFYYDLAMAPYHIWSDLRDRNESSVGKCLPGDQAPFTIPCEKFSVTGLVGEAGAIVGVGFLFP